MRKLVFLFAIFFSLAGMSTFTQAQEDTAQGEALIEQYLPDGVTLETASAAQIESALTLVSIRNSGDAAAIQAAVTAATNSPRVTNRPSTRALARGTVMALGLAVSNNAIRARYNISSTTVADPEQISIIVNNLIRTRGVSVAEVNDIIEDFERRAQFAITQEETDFLNEVMGNVRGEAARVVQEESGGNQTCTTSNDVVTCTPG